jgi:hypothetical protein
VEAIDLFVKNLSSEELVLLQKYVTRSKFTSEDLKEIFKNFNELSKSLKPMSYQFGDLEGVKLDPNNPYYMRFLEERFQHTYKSDVKDVKTFYESLLLQLNGSKADFLDPYLREQVEVELGAITRGITERP